MLFWLKSSFTQRKSIPHSSSQVLLEVVGRTICVYRYVSRNLVLKLPIQKNEAAEASSPLHLHTRHGAYSGELSHAEAEN
jgi:hypothetical protein